MNTNLLEYVSHLSMSVIVFNAKSRKPAKDDYTPHRQEVCTLVCLVLVNNSGLASALVGVFGKGSVLPALRLGWTLIQNGPLNVHLKLASSGFLVPINDMLRNGLICELYQVSILFCFKYIYQSFIIYSLIIPLFSPSYFILQW